MKNVDGLTLLRIANDSGANQEHREAARKELEDRKKHKSRMIRSGFYH